MTPGERQHHRIRCLLAMTVMLAALLYARSIEHDQPLGVFALNYADAIIVLGIAVIFYLRARD